MALAFVIARMVLGSAIIEPRTKEQLDDLLSDVEIRFDNGLLDRIDEILPPGVEIARLKIRPMYLPRPRDSS